jgi:protein CpxP
MKKIASILILVFAFTLTTQAQRKGERQKFTAEQHAALAVKKMTLILDLSEKQQNQIRPLIGAQAANKKAAILKRKENRATEERRTSDEIFAIKSTKLDNQIAFKNEMKDILTKEQFEKFKKIRKERKIKRVKKEKMMKERKKGRP